MKILFRMTQMKNVGAQKFLQRRQRDSGQEAFIEEVAVDADIKNRTVRILDRFTMISGGIDEADLVFLERGSLAFNFQLKISPYYITDFNIVRIVGDNASVCQADAEIFSIGKHLVDQRAFLEFLTGKNNRSCYLVIVLAIMDFRAEA